MPLLSTVPVHHPLSTQSLIFLFTWSCIWYCVHNKYYCDAVPIFSLNGYGGIKPSKYWSHGVCAVAFIPWRQSWTRSWKMLAIKTQEDSWPIWCLVWVSVLKWVGGPHRQWPLSFSFLFFFVMAYWSVRQSSDNMVSTAGYLLISSTQIVCR